MCLVLRQCTQMICKNLLRNYSLTESTCLKYQA
uniref:Uncharacterized protein n=1 Tax=Rhizophora mucronata TaxID=61149 RepID=A0A2P2NGS3_RHIMU